MDVVSETKPFHVALHAQLPRQLDATRHLGTLAKDDQDELWHPANQRRQHSNQSVMALDRVQPPDDEPDRNSRRYAEFRSTVGPLALPRRACLTAGNGIVQHDGSFGPDAVLIRHRIFHISTDADRPYPRRTHSAHDSLHPARNWIEVMQMNNPRNPKD